MFHFDVLPNRPKPRKFESITGYLIYLGQINLLHSVDGLSFLLFPDQDRRITRSLLDYPPLHLERLSEATYCSKELLLQTTFFHVGRKFARSTHPQPLSRFLSDAVAKTLRYCPKCLQEKGYYSLTWRFLFLDGCAEHNCQLLDHCTHCGEKIPIFASLLKLGICPHCYGDMRECIAPEMDKQQRMLCANRLSDLEFVLSSHPCEEDSHSLIKFVGKHLAQRRAERQLSSGKFAQALGLSLNTIEGIERGNILTKGATFPAYIKYADYVGANFQELFSIAMDNVETEQVQHPQIHPDALYNLGQDAVRSLTEQNRPVTQKAVSNLIGVSPDILRNNRRLVELIRQRKENQRQQAEQATITKLASALEDMKKAGKRISQYTVADALGVDRSVLRYTPSLLALVKQFKNSV